MKKTGSTSVKISLAVSFILVSFASNVMASSWQRVLTCENGGEFGRLVIDVLTDNGQKAKIFQAVIVGRNPVDYLFSPISSVTVPNIHRIDSGTKIVVEGIHQSNAILTFNAADGAGKIQVNGNSVNFSILYVGREPAFGRNWQFHNCN